MYIYRNAETKQNNFFSSAFFLTNMYTFKHIITTIILITFYQNVIF